jgi:hypothetical protein
MTKNWHLGNKSTNFGSMQELIKFSTTLQESIKFHKPVHIQSDEEEESTRGVVGYIAFKGNVKCHQKGITISHLRLQMSSHKVLKS